jgi:hypothetical protein
VRERGGGRGEREGDGEGEGEMERGRGGTFQTPSADLISLAKANNPASSIFFRISIASVNSLQKVVASFSTQF